jgi:hypothetical protein
MYFIQVAIHNGHKPQIFKTGHTLTQDNTWLALITAKAARMKTWDII